MSNNVAKLRPVPLKPVIDVEASEVTAEDEHAAAVNRYVEMLMRLRPGMPRKTVRFYVGSDLQSMAEGKPIDCYGMTYLWAYINGELRVSFKS